MRSLVSIAVLCCAVPSVLCCEVKELTEHIEAESREASRMEVVNKDECYEICCDEQYKDVVKRQIIIASNIDNQNEFEK